MEPQQSFLATMGKYAACGRKGPDSVVNGNQSNGSYSLDGHHFIICHHLIYAAFRSTADSLEVIAHTAYPFLRINSHWKGG